MKKVARKKAAQRATLKRPIRKKAARKKAAARKAPRATEKMLPEPDGKAVLKAPKVEFTRDYHTSQIYSMGFEFAFAAWQKAKGLFLQACTFVYCKDFLHDAVWAFVNNKPWQIYSFKYTPGTDVPLDMDNCVLLFRNTDYKGSPNRLHDTLPACQQFLNGIEAKLGFEPSQIHKIPHDQAPCWLVVGDKGWQHAPPMLGLYTLLIRIGVCHKLGDTADATVKRALDGEIKIGDDYEYAGHRDSGYIQQSEKGIKAILKHGLGIFHPEMKDNYPEKLQQHGLHDNFGPVNFTQSVGNPKQTHGARAAMPFWYRPEIWGK